MCWGSLPRYCMFSSIGTRAVCPVVAVDDVRLHAEIAQRLQTGAGEVGEPLAVVGVAVGRGAVEILLVVEEVDLEFLLARLQTENADVFAPPGQLYIEVAEKVCFSTGRNI